MTKDDHLTACNAICKVLAQPQNSHTLNTAKTVAVATHVYWQRIDSETPRGVKLQLLGAGGVATYGAYHGDAFWTHWAPLPRRAIEENK